MRILICDDDPLAIEQIHKKFKIFFLHKKHNKKSDYPLKHSIYQHFQGNKHINLLLIYY